MIVMLLDDRADLTASLAKFDARQARCFDEDDRQYIYAIIEAAFGTFVPFNKLVHGVFKSAS